jgi:hypothetical protein
MSEEVAVEADWMLPVEDIILAAELATLVSSVNAPWLYWLYRSSIRVLAAVVIVERLARDSCAMGWAEIHTPLSVSKSKSMAVLSTEVSTMPLSSPTVGPGVGVVGSVRTGVGGTSSSSGTFAGI